MQLIRQSKLLRFYVLTLVLGIGVFTAIFMLIPSLQMDMIREDYILENVTALLFFGAFVLCIVFLLTTQRDRFSWYYIFIPLIALIFFLDEVSFATRLTDSGGGLVIFDYEIDGIHDVVELVKIALPRLRFKFGDVPVLLGGIALVVASGALIVYLNQRFSWIHRARHWFPYHIPLVVFLCGVVAFIGISVILDNEILFHETRYTVFFEELSEACSGVSLLFAALYLRNITRKTKSH